MSVETKPTPEYYCVRLRGLPYSATEEQIKEFFGGLTVVDNGITFTSSTNGRPSGECYCEFASAEEMQEALKKDRENLGSRYVEVFEVGGVEMEQFKRRKQLKENSANQGFIRVRGLPYNCKKEDLVEFFQGLTVEDVVFGKEQGIEGRPTGEGFICFASSQEADRALQLNGKHLGSRYLEIFKSDGGAYEQFKDRSTRNIVPLRSIPALSEWAWVAVVMDKADLVMLPILAVVMMAMAMEEATANTTPIMEVVMVAMAARWAEEVVEAEGR
uniref:RRM domain-containing protein n=1 Tax=Ditylenchus dipsaci TaxID=166011 RepID=A0A915ECE2_9BILA